MTARAMIDRRFRAVMRVVFVGFALFVAALVADKGLGMPEWVWVFGLAGFGVAWLTMMGAWIIGFRCPQCSGRLTPLLFYSGRFRLDPRIRFCPYCGKDLDSECEARADNPLGRNL